jgi:hypothetical protein
MGAQLFWPRPTSGQDIHLTVGMSSGRLDQRLIADLGNGVVDGDKLTAPWSLIFQFPDDPDTWSGIEIDPVVGRVSVPGPLPEPPDDRVLQIHVGAQLHHEVDGLVDVPVFITIWIHTTVHEVWATPRELTVHAVQSRPSRLSLMARFEDSFVADVSAWLAWWVPSPTEESFAHVIGDAGPLVSWSTPSTQVLGVEMATGKLNGAEPGSVEVTATIALPGVQAATATVHVVEPWSTPTRVEPLDGVSPALADQMVNVLFLPDGFLAEDEALFTRTVAALVRTLNREDALQPFQLLAERIAYWWAWLPSRQRGTTMLTEGIINESGRFQRFPDLEAITAPAVRTGFVQLEQGRLPLNENDTAFHLALGERRRAQPRGVVRQAMLNPIRLEREDLDSFLGALTHPEAPSIGMRWATGGPDQAHVVIVGFSSAHGGSNQGSATGAHLIGLTTGTVDDVPVSVPPKPSQGFDIGLPPGQGTSSALELAALVAHEVGHSWGLGDEYTHRGDPVSTVGSANLHTIDEVSDPLTGRLSGTGVRWGWPRLTASALLVAPPEASAEPLAPGDATWHPQARVLVILAPEGGDGIGLGDVVRLRSRPLLTAVTSVQHRITAIARRTKDLAVELEPLVGTTDLLGSAGVIPFPPGSLLIKPRPEGTPGSSVVEACLLHPAVRQHLSDHGNPLNADPAAGDSRACQVSESREPPIKATNMPPGLSMPTGVASWRLVGLVEGGGGGAVCGVYHPAGGCMMNRLTGPSKNGKSVLATPFCAVCQYIMIDWVHPPLHPEIDRLYDAIYPVLRSEGDHG